MDTGTYEIYKIELKPVEFKSDAARWFIALDRLQSAEKALQKLVDYPLIRKQAD